MPIHQTKYGGLKRRSNYEEELDYLLYHQEHMIYPDRAASQMLKSPYMTQFHSEHFNIMSEQDKKRNEKIEADARLKISAAAGGGGLNQAMAAQGASPSSRQPIVVAMNDPNSPRGSDTSSIYANRMYSALQEEEPFTRTLREDVRDMRADTIQQREQLNIPAFQQTPAHLRPSSASGSNMRPFQPSTMQISQIPPNMQMEHPNIQTSMGAASSFNLVGYSYSQLRNKSMGEIKRAYAERQGSPEDKKLMDYVTNMVRVDPRWLSIVAENQLVDTPRSPFDYQDSFRSFAIEQFDKLYGKAPSYIQTSMGAAIIAQEAASSSAMAAGFSPPVPKRGRGDEPDDIEPERLTYANLKTVDEFLAFTGSRDDPLTSTSQISDIINDLKKKDLTGYNDAFNTMRQQTGLQEFIEKHPNFKKSVAKTPSMDERKYALWIYAQKKR